MYILYHHHHAVSVADMAAALSGIRKVRLQQASPTHIVLWEDDWPIHVHVNTEAYVKEEAREIAQFAEIEAPAHRDRVATSDCRIEVSYEPDPEMRYFNTWLLVIERLVPLVDGVVFDTQDATFPYAI